MGNCIAFDKHSDDTYFTQIRRKSEIDHSCKIVLFKLIMTKPRHVKLQW